jgi:hypothetical protein
MRHLKIPLAAAVGLLVQTGLSGAQIQAPAVISAVNTLNQLRVYSENCGLTSADALRAEFVERMTAKGRFERHVLEGYIDEVYREEKNKTSGSCVPSHIENLGMIYRGQLDRAVLE